MYVRNLFDKEKMEEVAYGMELPEKYLAIYNNIITQSMESMQSLFDKYLGTAEEPKDPEQETGNEENKDDENTENTESGENTDISEEGTTPVEDNKEDGEDTKAEEETPADTEENAK